MKNQWFLRFQGCQNRWEIYQKSIEHWSPSRGSYWVDFPSIWGGFGSQVGEENRAKSDQKSILKGIEKIMNKKSASWRRLGAQKHPKRNQRVFIHTRLHFTDICCVFPHWRTVTIYWRVEEFCRTWPTRSVSSCVSICSVFLVFVSRFHLFSLFSLRRYARFTRFARSRASRAQRIESTKPQLTPSILSTLSSALRALHSLRSLARCARSTYRNRKTTTKKSVQMQRVQ